MNVAEDHTAPQALSWHQANQAYLDLAVQRLRLRIQRRVLWLRAQWEHDPLQPYRGMVVSDERADVLLAGGDRQAEARFLAESDDAAQLEKQLQQIEQEWSALAEAMEEAEAPASVEAIAAQFGLSDFERDVLLLAWAPEADPTLSHLFAYLQDDPAKSYPTPHLARTLLVHPSQHAEARAARDRFLSEAPLRYHRLIDLDREAVPGKTLSAAPLLLCERIASAIQGVNRLDERVAEWLRPVPAAPLAPAHDAVVARLRPAIAAALDGGTWPVINLTGNEHGSKPDVAAALAQRLGRRLFALDVPSLGASRHATARLLEREAALLRLAFFVDAAELDGQHADAQGAAPQGPAPKALLRDVAEGPDALLIVASREHWTARRDVITVPVPPVDAADRRALWQHALGEAERKGAVAEREIGAVAQQFHFSGRQAVQAVAAARRRATLRTGDPKAPFENGDLWKACHEQVSGDIETLAHRLEPTYTWDDIVLPGPLAKQLRHVAAQVAHRARVYDQWGFGAKLSRGRGISALFAGPSGTGKTMAAEILANDLQLDLYRIDLSGVVSKYIGETEKNLRRVFDAAERSGAILFFDEADALFGKRTEVRDSHDRYANIEVNYLLQRMEAYQGLAILATNRKGALDTAFLRRLRFVLDFPFPGAADRRRIWRIMFPPEAPVSNPDFDALARLELAGGNIKNVALGAAFLAADEGATIDMRHLMRAAAHEYVKIGKMITEGAFGRYYHLVTT